MTSILEATMLVCFGFSWPMNLIKNIKAKTAKSMSLKFILLIIAGYIAGIMAKIISNNINYVLIIYLINLLIVSLNLIVYYKNKKLDKVHDRQIEKQIKVQPKSDRQKTETEEEFSKMNQIVDKNGTVIFGSNYFSKFPFYELDQSICIKENIQNRSVADKSIDELIKMTDSCIFELAPSKVFVNIGEYDIQSPSFNIDDFISKYEWLLYTINNNTNASIYIVSILSSNPVSIEINNKLKSLSNNYGCKFIDLTSVVALKNNQKGIFNILKSSIRTSQIDFYDAMNA